MNAVLMELIFVYSSCLLLFFATYLYHLYEACPNVSAILWCFFIDAFIVCHLTDMYFFLSIQLLLYSMFLWSKRSSFTMVWFQFHTTRDSPFHFHFLSCPWAISSSNKDLICFGGGEVFYLNHIRIHSNWLQS